LRYPHLHAFRCKVCQSQLAAAIDFQKYYRDLTESEIIKFWVELHLNQMNLWNHFHAKGAEPFKQFWFELKHRAKLEGLTDEEILDEARVFYEHGEAHAYDAGN
jgi:hypothetical protein